MNAEVTVQRVEYLGIGGGVNGYGRRRKQVAYAVRIGNLEQGKGTWGKRFEVTSRCTEEQAKAKCEEFAEQLRGAR